MNLFQNKFVQAAGVGAVVYLALRALGWAIEAILIMFETFSRWYRLQGLPWAEEAAIAIAIIYFIVIAVTNSKSA